MLLLAAALAEVPLYVERRYCPDTFEPEGWTNAAAVWETHRVIIDGVSVPEAPEVLAPEVVFTLRLALVDGWTEHTVARVTLGQTDLLLRQKGDVLYVQQAPKQRSHLDLDSILADAGMTLEDGDRPWDEAGRQAVAAGLMQLRAEERALLRGLTFQRHAEGKDRAGEFRRGERPTVKLYDSALGCPNGFHGTPGAGLPPGTSTVLHELGHAIGHAHRVAGYSAGRAYEAEKNALRAFIPTLSVPRELFPPTLPSGWEEHRRQLAEELRAGQEALRLKEQRRAEVKALLADLAERRAAQEAAVESWTDGDAGRSLQSLLDAGGILDDEEGDLLRRQAALDARDPPAEAAMDRCTKNLAFLDLLERAPGGPDAAWWYLVAQKRVGTRSPYEARQDRLLQAWAIDPTHAAYASIPGAVPGPTAYASTSVIESFAESFMLFHLDPEALKAVTPQVHAWFAAGSHLDAARAGLRTLELVVDPASTGERQAP